MIKVYLSLLILVQSSLGFAQFKQSGMRKATHQEVKEIVPEEIKNKTKEFSSKVGPLIQNEVSQKILLNK